MTVEIISWSISTKVWDRAGIELATPGIAVRHASVARHVTDCATRTVGEHTIIRKHGSIQICLHLYTITSIFRIFQKSQFENLTFSLITFREILRLNHTSPSFFASGNFCHPIIFANNHCKQFGPQTGTTEHCNDSNVLLISFNNSLVILVVLLIYIKLSLTIKVYLYKHQDTTDLSYIQYNAFERDTK